MSEIQRRESNEHEALQRQWQVAQRNTAVEQWQGMSLLRDSRFQPHAAQQTVDQLFPSYGEIFGHDSPSHANAPNADMSRNGTDFTSALANDPKALLGNLDQLLRLRVANWGNFDPAEVGVWSDSCRDILARLANINNQSQYRDSFRHRNLQEAWQMTQKKMALDDSWNAWQSAFSTVQSLSPHNRAEAENPSSVQQKEHLLRIIEGAERRSGISSSGSALPMIPKDETMPPIAPQRHVYHFPRTGTLESDSSFAGNQTGGDISHFPRRKLKF